MNAVIPEKLKNLAAALGKPLYVVGGACRDFIAGLDASKRDWDICAPAPFEEVCNAAISSGLSVTATYKNTGTVRMCADGEEYEFTSFRTDKYVHGRHTPTEIFFTDDITLDARRRDFKCNAVYYDIGAGSFCDPLGGIADIKAKRVSTVTDADKVFGEDGLRLMRLARICAQTGFKPDVDCMNAAKKNCRLIGDIAAERIWTELNAILHSDEKYAVKYAQYNGLAILRDTGVLAQILPELALGENMSQRADFHSHDVLEHTLRCVMYSPPEIRLAALLHDVGKPYCKLNYGKFARHEEEGERIALEICKRLRVGKRECECTAELVRWHMYDLSGGASENKVRKFMVAHAAILDDLIKLKQADYSACKDDLSVAPCVVKWQGIYSKMQKEGVPLSLKQLNVKGDKLIEAGICPDETAKTLQMLLGECVIGNVPNDEERLIKYALARRGERK